MKKIKSNFLIFNIGLISLILIMNMFTIQSCKPEDDDLDNCDSCVVVLKPNIYFFPQENINADVFLNFPQGGNIIYSIPEYLNGWSISIDTLGIIDNSYEYLFYESKQPDIWQYEKGWVVKKDDLSYFFNENLLKYGFGDKEISDFIDYWIPRLDDYEYYEIYPQEKQKIGKVIELYISVAPDNILRLFYAIKGAKEYNSSIENPIINIDFKRDGFYITEWGVIII